MKFYVWYSKDLEEINTKSLKGGFDVKQFQGRDVMETVNKAFDFKGFEKQLVNMEREFLYCLKKVA